MFLLSVRTYMRSIETNGYALNFGFASMFSEDAITLALSDAVLVLSTAICVPFSQAIAKGWIQYYGMGVVLHHIWQTSVLCLAVTWTFDRLAFEHFSLRFRSHNLYLDTGHGCNQGS